MDIDSSALMDGGRFRARDHSTHSVPLGPLEHRALSSDTRHTAHIMKFRTQVSRSLLGSLVLCISVAAQELEVQKLTAPTPAANSTMGNSVAIEGTRIVVGQRSAESVLVFEHVAGSWQFDTELSPPVGLPGLFGTVVGLSGDTVVVGSPREDSAVPDAGGAYVFALQSGVWVQTEHASPLSYHHRVCTS